MSTAQERLAKTTGIHSPSPEVPRAILQRDVEILAVGQAGYRVSRYGTMGLELLFRAVGESARSEPLREWAWAVGRGTGAILSLLGLLWLRGRASREIAFGAVWENLTAGVDWTEEQVRRALGAR